MKGEAKLGDYRIAYDFNALCDAEGIVGPIGAAMQEIAKGSFTTIRALLWAGLIKHHGDVGLNEAGSIIAQVGFAAASEAIGTAMQSAFPDVQEKLGNVKAAKAAKAV